MRALHILTATMILAAPAAAMAQYERLANPPDPVAQRDELIALYDDICLRAFPDDGAAGAAAARHGGTPLSEAEVRRSLRGRGSPVPARRSGDRLGNKRADRPFRRDDRTLAALP
jgi:hypothetical protein